MAIGQTQSIFTLFSIKFSESAVSVKLLSSLPVAQSISTPNVFKKVLNHILMTQIQHSLCCLMNVQHTQYTLFICALKIVFEGDSCFYDLKSGFKVLCEHCTGWAKVVYVILAARRQVVGFNFYVLQGFLKQALLFIVWYIYKCEQCAGRAKAVCENVLRSQFCISLYIHTSCNSSWPFPTSSGRECYARIISVSWSLKDALTQNLVTKVLTCIVLYSL